MNNLQTLSEHLNEASSAFKHAVQQAIKAAGYNLKQSDVKVGAKKVSGMGTKITLNGEMIGFDDNIPEMIASFTKSIQEDPEKYGLKESVNEGSSRIKDLLKLLEWALKYSKMKTTKPGYGAWAGPPTPPRELYDGHLRDINDYTYTKLSKELGIFRDIEKALKDKKMNPRAIDKIIKKVKASSNESVNEGLSNYSLLDFFKEMQSFPAAGVDAKDIKGASQPHNKKKTVKNTPALQSLLDEWKSGRYDEDPGTLVDELRYLLTTDSKDVRAGFSSSDINNLDDVADDVSDVFSNKGTLKMHIPYQKWVKMDDDEKAWNVEQALYKLTKSNAVKKLLSKKEGEVIDYIVQVLSESVNEASVNFKNIQPLNEFGPLAGSNNRSWKTSDLVDRIGDLEDKLFNGNVRRAEKEWEMVSGQYLTGEEGSEYWADLDDDEVRSAIDDAEAIMKKYKMSESVNEAEMGGYYLMKQLKDMSDDMKRDEPKAAAALMYLYDRINQSARDIDLNADDLDDFLREPRGRKHSLNLPDWMIHDLFVESFIMKEDLNEGSTLIWDVIGDKIDDLSVDLKNLRAQTTDPSWQKAISSIDAKLQKLDYDIGSYDRKLGAITLKESVNEAKEKYKVEGLAGGEWVVVDSKGTELARERTRIDAIKAKRSLEESVNERKVLPNDETIKFHIDSYRVDDDPYDVAKEIGSQYNWTEREIEKAEKILRKKYLK